MFVIYAAIALLDARYFAELKPAADAQPLPAPKGKGKGWYWGGLAFGAIMGMILYPTIYAWCSKNRPAFWNQGATWYIGTHRERMTLKFFKLLQRNIEDPS